MNILVTGGAGFVGSNLAVLFKEKHPDSRVIALDSLKRRGSELNIPRLKETGIEFVHGDIRNPEDLRFKDIDVILECSAEPSVLAGYGESPMGLISTNLLGTVNCLEVARKNKSTVVFLSSSRVYPYDRINGIEYDEGASRFEWKSGQDILGLSKEGIGEDFPLEGIRSMYGATKLSSELILQEYISMYGVKGVINRCGVISGPWQFGKADQGVFTLWMMAHYFRKPLKYIGYGGEGKQVRDVVHIRDLFELVDKQINDIDKVNGKVYNVGGGRGISLSLLEATKLCEKITGNSVELGSEKENRPADIPIYLTDNSRVTRDLGWKPKRDSRAILEDIFSWVRDNESDIKRCIL